MPMARTARQLLIREMARIEATRVLSESTRAAIEKMAEEFAQDMLKDPVFRAYLRDEATKAARAIAEALREQPDSE
jgi:pantoate kinase